jgi:hypothetical protein
MKTVTFTLIALLSVIQNTQTETISFINLKPDQAIKVEWRYQACFTSNNYNLSFSGEPSLQVVSMNLAETAYYGDKFSRIRITKSDLEEWDKMLAEYRGEEKGKCGLSEESVTISLHENESLISKEVFLNKCASSRLWDFVASLKKGSS